MMAEQVSALVAVDGRASVLSAAGEEEEA